jgi:hypothetical protein
MTVSSTDPYVYSLFLRGFYLMHFYISSYNEIYLSRRQRLQDPRGHARSLEPVQDRRRRARAPHQHRGTSRGGGRRHRGAAAPRPSGGGRRDACSDSTFTASVQSSRSPRRTCFRSFATGYLAIWAQASALWRRRALPAPRKCMQKLSVAARSRC